MDYYILVSRGKMQNSYNFFHKFASPRKKKAFFQHLPDTPQEVQGVADLFEFSSGLPLERIPFWCDINKFKKI